MHALTERLAIGATYLLKPNCLKTISEKQLLFISNVIQTFPTHLPMYLSFPSSQCHLDLFEFE